MAVPPDRQCPGAQRAQDHAPLTPAPHLCALPPSLQAPAEQVVAALKRQASGGCAARQSSLYRGVSRHAKGRWEVRRAGGRAGGLQRVLRSS